MDRTDYVKRIAMKWQVYKFILQIQQTKTKTKDAVTGVLGNHNYSLCEQS